MKFHNCQNVEVELSQDATDDNVTNDNYLHVHINSEGTSQHFTFSDNTHQKLNSMVQWMGVSMEQFYFYLVIALSSLLLLCLLILLGMCLCFPKNGCQHCKSKINNAKAGKRVSRAESWRYESSHYVNPRIRPNATQYSMVDQNNQRAHIASLLGRSSQVRLNWH